MRTRRKNDRWSSQVRASPLHAGGEVVAALIEVGPTAVTLDAAEDGLYLRAVGPSIEDPNHRAIYTVTLDWMPIIP